MQHRPTRPGPCENPQRRQVVDYHRRRSRPRRCARCRPQRRRASSTPRHRCRRQGASRGARVRRNLTPLSGFVTSGYRHTMAADPAPRAGSSLAQRPAVRRAVTYGAFPLIALAGTQFIQSGETNSIGFAVDGIQKAFGVSDFWIGFIPFAMNIAGIAGVLPFGYLADKGRRTFILAVGTIIWTVAMGFTGFATSFFLLLLARMWVGALEATSPAAISLIGDYWPVEQRSTKMSLYQLGNLVGAVAAFMFASVAVKFGGWRWAFWVWIPFGIASTYLLLRSPEPRRGNHDLREEVHAGFGALATADEVAEVGATDEL